MKQLTLTLCCGFLFLIVDTGVTFAQVKRVEMKIDGYLCGN